MSANVTRLVDLVRVTTRRQPGAPAIDFDSGSRTFAEVYGRGLKLAHALLGTGLEPGDAVGILALNSPEYLETYLALQLAGLVAVPVNFRLVAEEVAYVLGNCEARGLVLGEDFLPLFDGVRSRLPALQDNSVIVLGRPADHQRAYERVLEPAEAQNLARLTSPMSPATIFYTSGTTGFPKGAMMSHLNVLTRLASWGWDFGINAADVVLIPGPLFHMSFSSIALVTLSAGGRVILMNDFTANAALDLIERYRVTWSFLVPKMLSLLLDALAAPGQRRDVSSIRGILSSGSPLTKPVFEQLLQTFPGARIDDAYGWTETGWVSLCRHHDMLRKERSVGRAAFGCELAVLNDAGEEVRPGEVGEIFAANPIPFLGYYGNPEASSAMRRGKWETGADLGILDDDGFLYVVDRKKDMIVSGGENVYPAEIERVLAQHPKILEVAVVGVPNERWGESPRACVVLHPGQSATPEEIIGFCEGRIARYKHPRSVTFLETVPRNAMGKVLRRELRERYWQGRKVKVQ